MSGIEQLQQPVFRAKTAGRRFLTARGAADAEARALIVRKYPSERPCYEYGNHDPGYHWSSDARLVKVHVRLRRLILKSFRAAAVAATAREGQDDAA